VPIVSPRGDAARSGLIKDPGSVEGIKKWEQTRDQLSPLPSMTLAVGHYWALVGEHLGAGQPAKIWWEELTTQGRPTDPTLISTAPPGIRPQPLPVHR
jgi:hypothetical protein